MAANQRPKIKSVLLVAALVLSTLSTAIAAADHTSRSHVASSGHGQRSFANASASWQPQGSTSSPLFPAENTSASSSSQGTISSRLALSDLLMLCRSAPLRLLRHEEQPSPCKKPHSHTACRQCSGRTRTWRKAISSCKPYQVSTTTRSSHEAKSSTWYLLLSRVSRVLRGCQKYQTTLQARALPATILSVLRPFLYERGDLRPKRQVL